MWLDEILQNERFYFVLALLESRSVFRVCAVCTAKFSYSSYREQMTNKASAFKKKSQGMLRLINEPCTVQKQLYLKNKLLFFVEKTSSKYPSYRR